MCLGWRCAKHVKKSDVYSTVQTSIEDERTPYMCDECVGNLRPLNDDSEYASDNDDE